MGAGSPEAGGPAFVPTPGLQRDKTARQAEVGVSARKLGGYKAGRLFRKSEVGVGKSEA